MRCAVRLSDLRDLASAVQRSRRLMDLDADPVAIAELLEADALLAPLVAKSPGRRSPGHVDGAELAVRAILGQQVSVVAARTHTARLVRSAGTPLPQPDGGLTHLFPEAGAVADADPAALAMPESRRRTLRCWPATLHDGSITIDAGADRGGVEAQLTRSPASARGPPPTSPFEGLGDPDVFLPSDLGVRRALERLGIPPTRPRPRRAEAWRPWRSYALHHLWSSLG